MLNRARRFRAGLWCVCRGVIALTCASFAVAVPLRAQNTGSLTGTVVTDSADVPIANAEITFPKLSLAARSDSKGNFQITGVPAGPQELVVRVVGYEPYAATMTFRTAQKVEADFVLKPIVTKLANVNVKAAADPRYAVRLAEFEERRRFGTGRFLTADFFEKNVGSNMSQLLVSRLPGLRTRGVGTQQQPYTSRGGRPCPVQVLVNGLAMFNARQGESPFDVNSIFAHQVIGLEFYTLANTPAQLTGSGASACGTLLIWTK